MKPYTLTALVLSLVPALASAASFIPLEIAPGAFYDTRSPLAISADGTTVVGAMYLNNQQQAVRWINGGSPQFLGVLPGGDSSVATGVSADGSVIIGSGSSSGDMSSYRYTVAGGMQSLSGEPPGFHYEYAKGVSGNGEVVVGYDNHNNDGGAFRWTEAGGREYIGTLPYGGSPYSEALAISADGTVIVGQSSGVVGPSSGRQAFRWTALSGITALNPLSGATNTVAEAASEDGLVIVGNSYVPGCVECGTLSRNNAVSWTDQGPATLLGQVPGGDQGSNALAVSGDGSVVAGLYFVNANDPFRGFRAFVWTAGDGMQKLFDVLVAQGVTAMAGWTLLTASAVSADGRTITGQGLNPEGKAQAFVVTLNAVPIPAAVWLLGSGLSVMGLIRRKGR
jgi:uncharacterized membrane protein